MPQLNASTQGMESKNAPKKVDVKKVENEKKKLVEKKKANLEEAKLKVAQKLEHHKNQLQTHKASHKEYTDRFTDKLTKQKKFYANLKVMGSRYDQKGSKGNFRKLFRIEKDIAISVSNVSLYELKKARLNGKSAATIGRLKRTYQKNLRVAKDMKAIKKTIILEQILTFRMQFDGGGFNREDMAKAPKAFARIDKRFGNVLSNTAANVASGIAKFTNSNGSIAHFFGEKGTLSKESIKLNRSLGIPIITLANTQILPGIDALLKVVIETNAKLEVSKAEVYKAWSQTTDKLEKRILGNYYNSLEKLLTDQFSARKMQYLLSVRAKVVDKKYEKLYSDLATIAEFSAAIGLGIVTGGIGALITKGGLAYASISGSTAAARLAIFAGEQLASMAASNVAGVSVIGSTVDVASL